MRFPHAAKGITKIFIAEILSLFSVIASFVLIILIGVAGGLDNFNLSDGILSADTATVICGGVVITLLVISGILNIIGYIQSAKDDEHFVRAIVYAIVTVVLMGAAAFLQTRTGNLMEWITTIVRAVAKFTELMIVISAINGMITLSGRVGRDDLVSRGGTIINLLSTMFTLNIILIILNRVFPLFMSEDIINVISLIINIVIAVLTVIEYILYLSYLGRTSKMLRETR